jgi:hypothetical protein
MSVSSKMYKRPQLRNKNGTGGTCQYPSSHPLLKEDDAAVAWSHKFVPIAKWETYLRLQKANGATAQELEYLESIHKTPAKVYHVEPKPDGYNTKPVLVKVKVSGDGGPIRLVVKENKLATMLREYCSRGKLAPQKVWIEAWIQAGRSFQDVLAGIVRHRANKSAELPPCLSFTSKEAAAGPKVKRVLKPVVKIS